MLKVFLRDAANKPVEVLVEPQKMELFSDTWCRTSMPKNPSKRLFDKAMTFASHYLSLDTKKQKLYDDVAAIYGSKFRGQADMKEWCEALVHDIKDLDEIMEFIDLAETSGNQSLITIACSIIANDIMTTPNLDEFRAKYRITNDFSQKELDVLMSEDKLWRSLTEDK